MEASVASLPCGNGGRGGWGGGVIDPFWAAVGMALGVGAGKGVLGGRVGGWEVLWKEINLQVWRSKNNNSAALWANEYENPPARRNYS